MAKRVYHEWRRSKLLLGSIFRIGKWLMCSGTSGDALRRLSAYVSLKEMTQLNIVDSQGSPTVKAVLFDLCSTVVLIEQLQALSFAWAALELRPELIQEDVIEAYKKSAGKRRQETAEALMLRFDFQAEAWQQMSEWRAHHPWQAFTRLRYQYHQAMLESPDTLRKHFWGPNRPLLSKLREHECKVGLVTMVNYDEAWRILGSIRLDDAFDLVVARDDVERGKPDPEIYLLAAQQLELAPPECLEGV